MASGYLEIHSPKQRKEAEESGDRSLGLFMFSFRDLHVFQEKVT